jgi:hypothetical protein
MKRCAALCFSPLSMCVGSGGVTTAWIPGARATWDGIDFETAVITVTSSAHVSKMTPVPGPEAVHSARMK